MTEAGGDEVEDALADFDALRLELAEVSRNWTLPVVVRSYAPGEEGEEDQKDEAMLFVEEHGYRQTIGRDEAALTATYRKHVIESTGAPATIVRTYRGSQQADAVAEFKKDASRLALEGYSPTTQSWAQGQWGCGAFLFALVLCILLIGFLVFIYMLLVKPEGTLTVTYTRNETVAAPMAAAPTQAPAATPAAQGSVRDRLAHLDELHGEGLVTDEEYAAKRAKILDEI